MVGALLRLCIIAFVRLCVCVFVRLCVCVFVRFFYALTSPRHFDRREKSVLLLLAIYQILHFVLNDGVD